MKYQNSRRSTKRGNTILSLVLALLLILDVNVQAQEIRAPRTIIPPSPDASGLGKYGQFPVGLHTGVPNISIPIGTVKGRSLAVPISLSYHASGFKVDEIASWVGLGWDLMAGGVVTRTIVGAPDDSSLGFYFEEPRHSDDIEDTQFFKDYMFQVALGNKDTESDYYFFNFLGRSGKFILNDDKEALQIPKSALKIDMSNYPVSFTITDESGTQFVFADREGGANTTYSRDGEITISYTSSWHLSRIIPIDTDDIVYFEYYDDYFAYLDYDFSDYEIIGDKWEIDLQTGRPTLLEDYHDRGINQTSRTIEPKRLKTISSRTERAEFIRSNPEEPRMDKPRTKLEEVRFFGVNGNKKELVKSFVFDNDEYFSYNNGAQVDPADPDQHRLRLDHLIEVDRKGREVSRYAFEYNATLLPPKGSKAQDYWGYYNGKNTNRSFIPSGQDGFAGFIYQVGDGDREPAEAFMKACILESITYPTGGKTTFQMEANRSTEYEEEESLVVASAAEMGNSQELLTESVTFTPNHPGWGTLMATLSNVSDVDPYFSRVSLKELGTGRMLSEFVYTPFTPQTEDFDPEYTYADLIFLTKDVTYELTVSAWGNSDSPELSGAAYALAELSFNEVIPGTTKTVGGLRISSMIIEDEDQVITKTYKYGINENGGGYLITPVDLSNSSQTRIHRLGLQDPNPGGEATCVYFQSERKTIYGNSLIPLTQLSGSAVVYPYAAEYDGTLEENNGKTTWVFNYAISNFYPVPSEHLNGAIALHDSWRGGQERERHYLTNHDPARSTQSSFTGYALRDWEEVDRFVAGDKFAHTGCRLDATIFSEYYWFDYPVSTGTLLNTTQVTVDYSSIGNQLLTSQQSMEYDQNYQMASQTMTDSEGHQTERSYRYPQDYDSSPGSVLQEMKDRHMVGVPIERFSLVEGEVTGATAARFEQIAGAELIKPVEFYAFETSQPTEFQGSANGEEFPGYTPKSSLIHDNAGNIIQILSNDGVPSTYLYSYDLSLPVAKVDFATLAEVTDALEDLPADFIQQLSSATEEEAILDMLNDLREELDANLAQARLTTYTHRVGVGPSSVTDPNGLTTHYLYDADGRLQYVKDHEDNILQQVEYHFANQNND